MSEEIINRVANSSLITIDLEELYPAGRTNYSRHKRLVISGDYFERERF